MRKNKNGEKTKETLRQSSTVEKYEKGGVRGEKTGIKEAPEEDEESEREGEN